MDGWSDDRYEEPMDRLSRRYMMHLALVLAGARLAATEQDAATQQRNNYKRERR